jgi:hypothetical protein
MLIMIIQWLDELVALFETQRAWGGNLLLVSPLLKPLDAQPDGRVMGKRKRQLSRMSFW